MGVICFFTVLVGTVSGTYWATVSPVLAEVLGLRDLPSGLSINFIALVPPTTVSEAIALLLRDHNSKDSIYLPVQIFTGFMYIGSALCLWIVRGWKVGERARAAEKTNSAAANGTTLFQLDAGQGDGGVDNKENEEQPAVHELPQTPPAPNIKSWSPLTLMRAMVALKRV